MVKRPTHSWKDPAQRDRTILILLKRSYPRSQIAQIFNRIFQRKLAQEGLSAGLAISTLDGQFQELKNGGTGYDIYERICNLSQTRLETEYAAHLQTIRNAVEASGSNIRFSNRALPTWNHTQPSKNGKKTRSTVPAARRQNEERARLVHGLPDTSLNQFVYDEQGHDVPNANVPEHINSDTIIVTPTTPQITSQPSSRTVTSSGRKAREPPVLLFRATPTVNEFKSRWWQTSRPKSQPPIFGTKEFSDRVIPHLQRDKSYASPFISFQQWPRLPLSKVHTKRSEEIDKKMFFVVFSFDDLKKCAIPAANGETGPYLVPGLFPGKRSSLINNYTGRGEWLIYGEISCEPVAILDAGQVIKFANAATEFGFGDASSLMIISECLRSIPDTWRKIIAEKVLSSKCASKLPPPDTQQYKLILEVVLSGNKKALRKLKEIRTRIAEEFTDDDDYEEEVVTPSKKPKSAPRKPLKPVQPKASNQDKALADNARVVERLNNLAAKKKITASQSAIVLPAERPSPLWSPDTDLPARPTPRLILEDDFEYDFVEDLPESAVRKIQRNIRAPRRAESVLPSIETSQAEYDFISTLKQHAFASSPTPVSMTGQNVHNAMAESDLPWMYIDKSASGNIFSYSKAPVTSRKRSINEEEEEEAEEDGYVIVPAAKRRKGISLQLRSLSVQDIDE